MKCCWKVLVALIATIVCPHASASAADIAWQADYEVALTEAQAEKKVVFIAVNMDGEKANDRLAKNVYHAKRIAQLADKTVNLIASAAEHSGKECKRFGTITCVAHQSVDVAVREHVLHPDDDGFVIAPQHVFLSPDGEVLLSVPYEISEFELEWCFVSALRQIDPEFEWTLSEEARPPRRLIVNGVVKLGVTFAQDVRPVTRDEMLKMIDEMKRGLNWEQSIKLVRQIVTSEEKEAMEFIKTLLRSGGGGGGGRGGGAGRGRDRRAPVLRAIGTYSPSKYWELVEEYAESSEEKIRLEAIVALEQLAAPESAKLVAKMLKKEKVLDLKKDWYRALAATTPGGDRAKRTLLKAIDSEKRPINRYNAVFALGYLNESEDVTALLFEHVDGESVEMRSVAAMALAMTRNADHKERLQERLEALAPESKDEDKGESKETESVDVRSIRAALAVLDGKPLSELREPVREVTKALLPRPRLFGISSRNQR